MNSMKTMNNLAEPSSTPTRLATIGMHQHQRNSLRMLFSTQCNKRYVLTEEASSEICILDLDSFGGEEKWREFRARHPQWPLILISINSREIADKHTLFVQKPVQVERLISTIEAHRNTLSGSDELATQAAPARDPSPQTGQEPGLPDPATTPSKSQSGPRNMVGTTWRTR
jgi:hypothetical protein